MPENHYDFERRPKKPAGANAPKKHANLLNGAAGGAIAGLVGMGIWAGISAGVGYEFGFLAWGIGALVGFAAWKCAGAQSVALGAIAAVIAVVAIFGGSYLPLRMPLHRQLYYQVANAWPDNLEFAERACKAQSDAELRCIVAEWNVEGDERPRLDLVTDADVAEFREKQLPVMQAIVSGEMTEDAWVDQTFDEIWGSVSFFRVLSYSVNLMTALWLILGVGSAIALAAGPPER